MKLANALNMAKFVLNDRLPLARCVVDATAGNGRDTLYLAENTGPGAVIWAFDIQQAALDNTQKLLTANNAVRKVKLIHDCHSKVAEYVTVPIDIVLFNLGYLPGASRELMTRAESTVAALRQFASLLAPEGMITVVAYPGTPSGAEEKVAVETFLASLPQETFTVACWQMLNQINNPPILFIVEKRGGTP